MKTYEFTATIHDGTGGGAYVLFPYDVQTEFGTRGRVPVRVKFDGMAYTGAMIKYGQPQHMLPILKAIRAQIGKGPGDTVQVEVRKDEAERTLDISPDFAALLKKEELLPAFEKLSYTHRKEYIRWIAEAKKEETRQRRSAKAIEMLHAGVKTPG